MQRNSPPCLPTLLSLGYQNDEIIRHLFSDRVELKKWSVKCSAQDPNHLPAFTSRHHSHEMSELGTQIKPD
jgi:hypothetical protein